MICTLYIVYAITLCVVLSYQQNCTITKNQAISLPDLAVYYKQRQDACCNICQNTTECKGFTWTTSKGGTCALKAGAEPLVYKKNSFVGITSGSVHDSENDNVRNASSRSIVDFFTKFPGLSMLGSEKQSAVVTYEEFANGVVNSNFNSYPRPSQEQYDYFIRRLLDGNIFSKEEACMALAQILHESDGLRATREYKCKDSGCPGEYVTVGCDVPNQFYYGRGYIQLTGCDNYKKASFEIFKDERLVTDPDMVARDEDLCWYTAFSYWKTNVHNEPGVSEGRFGVTTRQVNGPIECDNILGTDPNHETAKKRYGMYGRIRDAWNLPGPGNDGGCYN